MDDVDIMRNRTCDLVYEKYEDKKGVRFSTRRQITVSEKSKLDVKLDFKNYDFNETLSFPFSIPKNYDRNWLVKLILQNAVISIPYPLY